MAVGKAVAFSVVHARTPKYASSLPPKILAQELQSRRTAPGAAAGVLAFGTAKAASTVRELSAGDAASNTSEIRDVRNVAK